MASIVIASVDQCLAVGMTYLYQIYANTTYGRSSLGQTYKCPPGQQYTFFTGGNCFMVTDYEVFGLRQ